MRSVSLVSYPVNNMLFLSPVDQLPRTMQQVSYSKSRRTTETHNVISLPLLLHQAQTGRRTPLAAGVGLQFTYRADYIQNMYRDSVCLTTPVFILWPRRCSPCCLCRSWFAPHSEPSFQPGPQSVYIHTPPSVQSPPPPVGSRSAAGPPSLPVAQHIVSTQIVFSGWILSWLTQGRWG